MTTKHTPKTNVLKKSGACVVSLPALPGCCQILSGNRRKFLSCKKVVEIMLIATDEIICVPLRGIQQHKGEKTSLD
jgi:hypothetical protein